MKMQEYVENWLKTQKCVLMQEYARIYCKLVENARKCC